MNDSTEEFEPPRFRRFSCSSISERMVKKSSLEVGVWASMSGRVVSEPSVKRDSRRGRRDAEVGDVGGGDEDIVMVFSAGR